MFKHSGVFCSLSIDDVGKAKQFYGRVLGLDVYETPEGVELLLPGGARVFMYPSPRHAPASYTVLNFTVEDIDAALDGLAEAGVRMERYDWPDLKTDPRGVFRPEDGSGPKAVAWFKDPAGHILSVVQER
jgi:predicted enzyme related to lactoylglutathione lyase